MNKYISNKNELCNKYCDKKGQLTLVMLENPIRDNRYGGNDFKFVLYYLC